jgi:ribosomal-protein-alanine N-acetyltransferase
MAATDAFTQFPRLETPRLSLRQITMEDADALFATFSDPAVMEFYGELPYTSLEEARDLIRRQQHWFAEKEGIRWGITRKGEDVVIGSCGLFRFDEGFRRAICGYELNQAEWRQGIMSEALTVMLDYAFGPMDLHRVEAVVDDVNEKSKALLRKLGFTQEGTLRQRFYFRERFLDEHYFGILRDEWKQR